MLYKSDSHAISVLGTTPKARRRYFFSWILAPYALAPTMLVTYAKHILAQVTESEICTGPAEAESGLS